MLIKIIRLFVLSFFVGLACAKHGSFLENCAAPRIERSIIIKTQESIDNGAVFLGKTIMSSSSGCHKRCCEKRGCNLVMLKYESQQVACFMFDCGSPSRCTFKTHNSYRNYAALDYTKADQVGGFTKEEITEAPTTTKPTTAYKTENWGRFDWFDATTTRKPKYIKSKYTGDYDKWLANHADKSASKTYHSETKPVNSWSGTASKNSYDSTKYGSYDRSHGMKNIRKPTVKTTVSDWEDFPRRVFVDNNPEFPDEPKSHTKEPVKTGDKMEKTNKPTAPPPKVTKAATKHVTKARVSNVVIRRLNIQENKAVIPLAVGLVLALLLLMAVIFRVKTSRRRRTKAFLTDDADYLINGMYL